MSDLTESVLVPAFFVQAAVGTGIVSAWFMAQKDSQLKKFGGGMAGYFLALVAWSLVVLIKPDDLKPLIVVGAIPFLLGSLAFGRAASSGKPASVVRAVDVAIGVTILATFVVRTFVYPSKPYFSAKGLLFFGLDPLAAALYIVTISISFLPAILVTTDKIQVTSTRSVMKVGLLVLFINSIILLSATNQTLLLINGVVLTASLVVLWVKCLMSMSATKAAA